MVPVRSLIVGTLATAALAAGVACAQPAAAPTAVASTPAASTATSAASNPASTATAAPAATAVTPRGSVAIGQDSFPASYSLDISGSGTLTNRYFWPAFDGLTRMSDKGELLPALAERWETPDAKTWTFRLRENNRFHDGTPLTAQDVKLTFDFTRNPANAITAGSVMTDVESIAAPDERTVIFTLKAPRTTFGKLTSLGFVVKGRSLDQADKASLASYIRTTPIGTGPFRVVKADQSSIEFEAAAASTNSPRGLPTLQKLSLINLPEPAARAAALAGGQVQIVEAVGKDVGADLRQRGFTTAISQPLQGIHMALDVSEGPTANLQVRKALNLAIDKRQIIDRLLTGNEIPDGQMLGKAVLGYNEQVQPYGVDVAQARALLAQGGQPNGFTIPMQYVTALVSDTVAQAIAADLDRVGVKVQLQPQELAIWRAAYNGPQNLRRSLFVAGLNWDQTWEADVVYRWWSSDFNAGNGRRWEDPQFNDLFQRAKSTLDERQRGQLYQQAARYMNDQVPAIFLWQTVRQTAYDPKKVQYDYTGEFPDMWTSKVRALN